MKRYTSDVAFDTHTVTISTVPPLAIEVAADSPCELIADKPILVVLVVNNQVVDQGQ